MEGNRTELLNESDTEKVTGGIQIRRYTQCPFCRKNIPDRELEEHIRTEHTEQEE